MEALRIEILLPHHVVDMDAVPGTTTPEPSPLVAGDAARAASPSSTEICVVAPRRGPRKQPTRSGARSIAS
jgi:hypothetical protein